MKLSTTNHTPVLNPPPASLDVSAQAKKIDLFLTLSFTVTMGVIFLLAIMDCIVFANVSSIVKDVLLVAGFAAAIGAFVTLFGFAVKHHDLGVSMTEKNTQNTLEWKQNDLIPYLNEAYGVEIDTINENMTCRVRQNAEEYTALLNGVHFEEAPGLRPYVYASVDYGKLSLSRISDMPKNN